MSAFKDLLKPLSTSGDVGTLLKMIRVDKKIWQAEQANPNTFWREAFMIFFPEYLPAFTRDGGKPLFADNQWRKLTLWLQWAHVRVLKYMEHTVFFGPGSGFFKSSDTRRIYMQFSKEQGAISVYRFVKEVLGIESGCLLDFPGDHRKEVFNGRIPDLDYVAFDHKYLLRYRFYNAMIPLFLSVPDNRQTSLQSELDLLVGDVADSSESFKFMQDGLSFIYLAKTCANRIYNSNAMLFLQRLYSRIGDFPSKEVRGQTQIFLGSCLVCKTDKNVQREAGSTDRLFCGADCQAEYRSTLASVQGGVIFDFLERAPIREMFFSIITKLSPDEGAKALEEFLNSTAAEDPNHVTKDKVIVWLQESVDIQAPWLHAILQSAALFGYLKTVMTLSRIIDPGANVNIVFRLAAHGGHLPVVKYLMQDTRVNPNDYRPSDRLALQLLYDDSILTGARPRSAGALELATAQGHLNVVKELLQYPQINMVREHMGDVFALSIAAEAGNLEMIKIYFENANISHTNAENAIEILIDNNTLNLQAIEYVAKKLGTCTGVSKRLVNKAIWADKFEVFKILLPHVAYADRTEIALRLIAMLGEMDTKYEAEAHAVFEKTFQYILRTRPHLLRYYNQPL